MNRRTTVPILLACACALLAPPPAFADYVGLEVIERADLTICKDQTEPEMPFKLDVCEIHVVLDNPADRVISVAFTNVNTTDPAGFFQHSMNFSNTAPGCSFVTQFPTLVCDSFVTLGVDCVDLDDNTTIDPDFSAFKFNSTGEVTGGWFNSAPDNGQGDPDANGRVMISRFSYKQNKNTSGDVCVFAQLAGSKDISAFFLQPFDCAVPGGGLPPGDGESTFCGDPDAGNCFEINDGTPFCNCAECCELVCAQDFICCEPGEKGWDNGCRMNACELCNVNRCQDCDGNGTKDGEDIDNGRHADCNANDIPDVCEIDEAQDPDEFHCTPGCLADCDGCYNNPECEPDCVVTCDPDCNTNGIPDECDLASGTSADCNCNDIPDECDLPDADGNGVPDECDDCNYNEELDSVDIATGTSCDCNSNGIPDECDIAVPGPMMLSGDDADDGGHCPTAASCGRLYPALFEWALTNSRVTPADADTPIVAIGVNGETTQARQALDAWLDDLEPRPQVEFVTDATTPSIAAVDFTDYSVVYIPSVEFHTPDGGITPAQLDMLNARQEDIKEFVNFLGGGLIALTEAGAESPGGGRNAYGWLPVCLDDQDVDHFRVCPAPELSLIPGHTAACGNMTRDPNQGPPYHTIFSGPPGFSGLRSHCKTVYVTFNHEPVFHDRSVLQRVGETPRNSCRFARSTVAIGDDG